MDTDGGTIADGLEVERGTNPLNAKDDMPPTPAPQVLVFELDKPVVLPGIQFEFNKAVIKPESESVLIQAYNSLNDHPEIEVEISGHADAIGSDEYNQQLLGPARGIGAAVDDQQGYRGKPADVRWLWRKPSNCLE